MPKDLASWLSYIENLHPKAIAMGLDRANQVIAALKLQPNFKIITVAGTNGKGSTCAMLELAYTKAGYKVGCYTSPHLLRYNERVRINCKEASDAELCAAFAVIEAARVKANVALTYFEVGTLAAIWHFMQAEIEVAVLEVGLGGRLDTVNAFTPDCAIVTSIDLDHQEYLGDTREKIGAEKAAIFRPKIPAICGDANPPNSLLEYAKKIEAELFCIHQDFDYAANETGWEYQLNKQSVSYQLPFPALQGAYQLNNASCAVTAIELLQHALPVTHNVLAEALKEVSLAGRFQTISYSPHVILDVAHNPHAAIALAKNLKKIKTTNTQVFAVFAMLADKDIKGVVEAVGQQIDSWYIATIDHTRGAKAADLAKIVLEVNPNARTQMFDDVTLAYKQAHIQTETCMNQGENVKIIVFGSFFTVSAVMQICNNANNDTAGA